MPGQENIPAVPPCLTLFKRPLCAYYHMQAFVYGVPLRLTYLNEA